MHDGAIHRNSGEDCEAEKVKGWFDFHLCEPLTICERLVRRARPDGFVNAGASTLA